MKKINEIYDCNYETEINDIKINSKEVKPGDIFVCTKGVMVDRHDFVDEAIENGAAFLIVKKDGDYKIPYLKVPDPNKELANFADNFYDHPTEKIKLIGVTGTDGKTTTATLIRQLLGKDVCGYIGTNGIEGKEFNDKNSNTTPECHLIYKYLDLFCTEGLEYASIETSSEAFFRKRLSSFKFDVAILTNITEDHLNVHKTIDNYIDSKKELFRQLKDDGIAIINIDDRYYQEFKTLSKKCLTYGRNPKSDICIKDIFETSSGTSIKFQYRDKEYNILSPLLGEFNVYNLIAAILCLIHFGFSIEQIIEKIDNITPPSGRCEFLDFGTDYKIVLDYAHTTNGLNSILTYLEKIKKNRIITVTGSAGEREKEKREKMGKVVLEKSDIVIFTMDDPRCEDPNNIIKDMLGTNTGCYKIVVNREEAIHFALDHARENDIILIAGKGRDNYMAIEDKYVPYCDYDVIEKYFK